MRKSGNSKIFVMAFVIVLVLSSTAGFSGFLADSTPTETISADPLQSPMADPLNSLKSNTI